MVPVDAASPVVSAVPAAAASPANPVVPRASPVDRERDADARAGQLHRLRPRDSRAVAAVAACSDVMRS